MQRVKSLMDETCSTPGIRHYPTNEFISQANSTIPQDDQYDISDSDN
jgi:hypothetical protein